MNKNGQLVYKTLLTSLANIGNTLKLAKTIALILLMYMQESGKHI